MLDLGQITVAEELLLKPSERQHVQGEGSGSLSYPATSCHKKEDAECTLPDPSYVNSWNHVTSADVQGNSLWLGICAWMQYIVFIPLIKLQRRAFYKFKKQDHSTPHLAQLGLMLPAFSKWGNWRNTGLGVKDACRTTSLSLGWGHAELRGTAGKHGLGHQINFSSTSGSVTLRLLCFGASLQAIWTHRVWCHICKMGVSNTNVLGLLWGINK